MTCWTVSYIITSRCTYCKRKHKNVIILNLKARTLIPICDKDSNRSNYLLTTVIYIAVVTGRYRMLIEKRIPNELYRGYLHDIDYSKKYVRKVLCLKRIMYIINDDVTFTLLLRCVPYTYVLLPIRRYMLYL